MKSNIKSYVYHVVRVTRTRHSNEWLELNDQSDESSKLNFDLLKCSRY